MPMGVPVTLSSQEAEAGGVPDYPELYKEDLVSNKPKQELKDASAVPHACLSLPCRTGWTLSIRKIVCNPLS